MPTNTSLQCVQTIGSLPAVKKNPLQTVEEYGISKVAKKTAKSFSLAIFAGAFIAIAFVFYITVTTGAAGAPWGVMRFTGGLAFSLGLILVVVCGGELFTSTVLTTVAWAQGLFSTAELMKCWVRVYFGNLVGAALMVTLIITAKMHLLDDGSWGINALHIAQHKLHHTWVQAFTLGILCNLLVCLGIWMTFTTKDILAKSMLLILPVAMFISSGFEHSIANMFMVPLGIMIKTISSPEFFSSHGLLAAEFADLTWSNFIAHNLIPVTLGNIVGGGVFVGLGYWLTEKDSKHANLQPQTIHANPIINSEQPQNLFTNKPSTNSGEKNIMKTALNNLTVNDVMDQNPLVLTADECIYKALSLLVEHNIKGAPVVDQQQLLIGFVSQQDILRFLWSEEYSIKLSVTISAVMQTEILSVDYQQPVSALLEFMVVDKEALFPVSNTGILNSYKYQSYDQRLKGAAAKRPSIYPVVNQGVVCGVISRSQIAKLITTHYYPDDKKQVDAA
ncbi:formate transporter FocA [Psychromonas sp.]|uniref:formate transporter FocA n=1 Tax=Psychromonas sp. TaxID=1884585 RepID=UPI00356AA201